MGEVEENFENNYCYWYVHNYLQDIFVYNCDYMSTNAYYLVNSLCYA